MFNYNSGKNQHKAILSLEYCEEVSMIRETVALL